MSHEPDEVASPLVGGALTSTFRHTGGQRPDWEHWRRLPLSDYRPQARLVRAVTDVPRPRVPTVDIHNHLGRWLTDDGTWMASSVNRLLDLLDDCGVELVVNLDGRWGEELDANLDRYDRAHPDRFATFAHLDWGPLSADAPPQVYLSQVDDAHRRGAKGLKIWKDLGLVVRDGSGALAQVDDPRVVAACRRAGELGMVVLIHTADPVAFFDPVDEHNERLEELADAPEWWFGDPGVHPPFAALMAALERLVAAAPGCAFVGAHVGGYAEDLGWVARMCAAYPNFHVDIGGRLAELGRQPRAFARLVERFPDRVLFGSDAFPPDPAAYRALYRFLETDDEHWPYGGEESGAEVPGQGRWTVSGAHLPGHPWGPAALEALYRGNARRLLSL